LKEEVMERGQNINRPDPGLRDPTEPIKNKEDIGDIKSSLEGKPLDYALFTLGINTGLMPRALLSLKYKDVRNKKPGDKLDTKVKGKKRDRKETITLNNASYNALQRLLKWKKYKDSDFLFTGQRGVHTPQSLNLKVKKWCKDLDGFFGGHTLRKTFGYHQSVRYGVDLGVLKEYFRHPSLEYTRNYLMLPEPPETENKDIFLNIL
jgi:integrase